MRTGLQMLLGSCVLFAAQVQAQTPEQPAGPPTPAPEMTTQSAAPTFSTRVNLVMVPVVVRDSKGRAVGSLKEEDFQLFDKGKPQLITRFSIERAGVAPAGSAPEASLGVTPADGRGAAAPDRFLAYFFDDVHLNAADLIQMRAATERHLAEIKEPNRRVAIFSSSGRVTLDFTDDLDKVHETLLRLQPLADSSERDECPPVGYYLADKIRNKNDTQAQNAMVLEAIACLHLDPTDQNSVQIAQSAVNAAVSRMLSVGPHESRLALIVLKDVVRRLSAAPGSRMILLLSPGFFLTTDLRPDETELMDRAIRANVTINSLDARGLYTIIPGGDASQRGVSTAAATAVLTSVEHERATAEADVMAELADATGGTFFHNDNGLQQGLKQLAAQPEFVYVLGFSPQNLKFDGSFHAVKVAVRNSKIYQLQARRGYYAPNHAADPELEAKQEVQEAFFSREEIQEIPVDLHTQFFKSTDVNARLTVLAKVDVRQIQFRKVEDRNNNRLTVIAGVFDRNGNFVTGVQQNVDMRLRDATLAKAQSAGITLRSNLDLTPGTYAIRVVVRDAEGRQMAARNGVVEIPY
jgi:VWFA-related protein